MLLLKKQKSLGKWDFCILQWKATLPYKWKGTPGTQKENQPNMHSGHFGMAMHFGNSSQVIEQIVGSTGLELRGEVGNMRVIIVQIHSSLGTGQDHLRRMCRQRRWCRMEFLAWRQEETPAKDYEGAWSQLVSAGLISQKPWMPLKESFVREEMIDSQIMLKRELSSGFYLLEQGDSLSKQQKRGHQWPLPYLYSCRC